jgi:hypothetical protein
MRILVAQLVEAERAAGGDFQRAPHRLGTGGITADNLGRRPQVALGIGEQPPTRRGQRAFLANAGEHVLQVAPLRYVVMHVIGGHQRDAGLA